MKNRKISGKEITWHIIGGLIWLGGLAWAVVGFIGGLLKAGNIFEVAEADFAGWIGFRLSFEAWGMIFLALGTFILLVNLFYFAKRTDMAADRASRRIQRLGK